MFTSEGRRTRFSVGTQSQTSQIHRLLIDPSSLPLLTVVVMLPTTIKHTLALFAGPLFDLAPYEVPWLFSVAGLPTMANEQSISFYAYGLNVLHRVTQLLGSGCSLGQWSPGLPHTLRFEFKTFSRFKPKLRLHIK